MKLPAQRARCYLQQNTWAMQPQWLETLAEIAARDHVPDLEAVLAKQGTRLARTADVIMRGDVAVIPVTGPIFRYANLFSEISGATSIETLATDLRTAMDNPAVRRIVLAIDSPGGMTNGTQEFADMVYAARDVKPITAYINELGASAAYLIAAAASEIVMAPMAAVGSIGVVATLRTDKDPDRLEIVSSQSPRKRPDPQTDEGLSQLQSHVDALAEVFVERVAQFRGVSTATVLEEFGQGGLLIGRNAVDAGMADRLGSLEEVIAGRSASPQLPQENDGMQRQERGRDGPKQSAGNLEAQWQRDPALRAAFADDFESFVAYSKAVERGAVKVVSGRVSHE